MTKANVVEMSSNKPILYEAKKAPNIRLKIWIEGIKPLLTYNPESMNASVGAKRGSRIPEPAAEAEAGVYRLDDGTCAVKGDFFRGAILSAAGAWKAAKRSTMKGHLAHIVITDEMLPLTHPADGKPIRDYTIDKRRAIVQKQGIVRHRPRFDEWATAFVIEVDPALVSDMKMVVDIAADAGDRIGVGDFRPGRNGPFGRFKVVKYQVLD